jgi:hypothetical protein
MLVAPVVVLLIIALAGGIAPISRATGPAPAWMAGHRRQWVQRRDLAQLA